MWKLFSCNFTSGKLQRFLDPIVRYMEPRENNNNITTKGVVTPEWQAKRDKFIVEMDAYLDALAPGALASLTDVCGDKLGYNKKNDPKRMERKSKSGRLEEKWTKTH